jgi:hypothetical protein
VEIWNALAARLWVAMTVPRRDEKGDVPGWVLVTIMTAGMVMAIWTLAEPELKAMLRNALNKVQ